MPSNTLRRHASRIGMAIALATGTAVVLTATAAPAYARKKKEEKKEKPNYSKEFVAAYQPFAKKMQGDTDPAELKAELPQVVAAATTDDDKLVAGQLTYNIGVKAKDQTLQRNGLAMMLDSGKLPPENLANNYFVAAQLAYQAQDWDEAISRAKQAAAAGFTKSNPNLLIAESYFSQDKYPEGLAAIDSAITTTQQAGQEVPESWIKRALSVAYKANMKDASLKYATMLASEYPSPNSWGDAIAVERMFNDFDGAPLLDLMRLAEKTGAMRNKRDYLDYLFAADARRIPGEVLKVLNQGIDAGMLSATDPSVSQLKEEATKRKADDQTALPELGNDADKGTANLATLAAAGDTFLSYGQAVKAIGYYTRALALPGVNTNQVLTRLGIAQIEAGNFTDAEASFAKVQGPRQPIAVLWGAYAAQKAKAAAAPAPAEAAPAATDAGTSQ